MTMRLFIPKERGSEKRVAASPRSVAEMVKRGLEVAVESTAAAHCGWGDELYAEQGAKIVAAADGWRNAELVFKVAPPTDADGFNEWRALKADATLIGMLEPHRADIKQNVAAIGATMFAMELLPRITRAQGMDVLSSQNNLVGYAAVIRAASLSAKVLPLMMTAAGTVAAARVLVIGAGVAGLQAIATAKRLGAVVSAFDVRTETAEQVASLGAKFIAVAGGSEEPSVYAEQMGDDYRRRQAELLKQTLPKQDIVITTALIPGKEAPIIISEEMVKLMQADSVIIDCAASQGGNCEGSKPGETVVAHRVVIDAPLNLAWEVAAAASSLYAKNLTSFAALLLGENVAGEDGKITIDEGDELLAATCIAKNGRWMPFA